MSSCVESKSHLDQWKQNMLSRRNVLYHQLTVGSSKKREREVSICLNVYRYLIERATLLECLVRTIPRLAIVNSSNDHKFGSHKCCFGSLCLFKLFCWYPFFFNQEEKICSRKARELGKKSESLSSVTAKREPPLAKD